VRWNIASIIERLDSLVLSANEITELTDWPHQIIEDWLNIIRNVVVVAQNIDILNELVQDAPTQAEFDALVIQVANLGADVSNITVILADTKALVESINLGKLRAGIIAANDAALNAEQIANAW